MIALPALRQAAPLLLCAAGVLAILPDPDVKTSLALCQPLVAIFGLPHGAADWWVAARTMPGLLPLHQRDAWPALFGSAYGAVALLAIGAIMYLPQATLALFILVSAYHFGEVELSYAGLEVRILPACALGLLPIAAPAMMHPQAFASLLAALGLSCGTALPFWAGAVVTTICLVATARIGNAKFSRNCLLEQSACLVLNIAASPVPAFAIYFCCVHAPRQAALLGFTGARWIIWSASLLAAGMIGFADLSVPGGLAVAGPKVLFWGLAVLTFPHALCGAVLPRLAVAEHRSCLP